MIRTFDEFRRNNGSINEGYSNDAEKKWNSLSRKEQDDIWSKLLEDALVEVRKNFRAPFGTDILKHCELKNGIYYFKMDANWSLGTMYDMNVTLCLLPSKFKPQFLYGFPGGDYIRKSAGMDNMVFSEFPFYFNEKSQKSMELKEKIDLRNLIDYNNRESMIVGVVCYDNRHAPKYRAIN